MELEIKKLYEDGFNYSEIGRKLNKSTHHIKKVIVNLGFKQLTKIRRCKYNVNEDYLDTIQPKQLWFLGLMAADGYVNNKKLFGLSQSGDKGLNIIEYVKKELKYDGPIYHSETIGEISHSLIITSEKLVNKLSFFNIVNKKSLIYELPNFENEAHIRDFVRGYIEGDGSIGVYNNGSNCEYLVVSFVGTKSFINDISNKIPIKYSNILKLKAANCFEIRWYGKKAINFCDWLYSNDELFYGEKYTTFFNFIKEAKSKFFYYNKKKQEVKQLLESGLSVKEIAKKTTIPFQTIYYWKKNEKDW